MCVCALFGLYVIQPPFAARSPNEKKKKEKKEKKDNLHPGISALCGCRCPL